MHPYLLKIKQIYNDHLFKRFFLLVILVVLINRIFGGASFLDDICNGGISSFESAHCGMDGRTPGSKTDYNPSIDVTLQPTTLITPYIYKWSGVYDDLHFKYHNFLAETKDKPNYSWFGISYPIGKMWFSWFNYDIFTHQEKPTVEGLLLPFIMWLANAPYWFLLAFIFAKLWKVQDWWKGKLVVVLLFISKSVLTLSPLALWWFLGQL